MKKQFFFVDAETDGLYGNFLSVAAMVTDADGNEIDSYYGAVRVSEDEIRTEWVKENVYPYLGNAALLFDEEKALLESFWSFWLRYRESAECVAYVPYPVESRLFTMCVMENPDERQFLGPFPLYDLATLLESKSIDFNCDASRLSGLNLCSHDAMNDVKIMAALWRRMF